MESTTDRYGRLAAMMAEIDHLQSTYNLIEWDSATGGRPSAAGEAGAGMMAAVNSMAHRCKTSAEYGELLASLIEDAEEGNLGPIPSAAVRRAWLDYDWNRRLPAEFVEKLTDASETCRQAWERARDSSDWAAVLPHFELVVELAREKAARLRHGAEPYDAFLHEWDHGSTAAAVQSALDSVRAPLMDLTRRIKESGHKPTAAEKARYEAQRRFGLGQQRKYVAQLATALGFSRERGRMAECMHPFTTILGLGDARFAIEYKADNVFEAFGSVVHEFGHWAYCDGLAPELVGTPLFNSASFVIDEGIAKFHEEVIGRSRSYLEWLLPMLPRTWTVDEVYRHVNQMDESKTRLMADEVTYDLHVMLRVAIERPLLNGALPARELPAAWDALSRELLDHTPPDHCHGVLQDDHWYAAYFGYFPTYTTGNLFASQLAVTVQREIPDFDDLLRRGEFAKIQDWLRERVYRHGAIYTTDEMVKLATGEALDPRYHLARLERRFGEVYGL